MSRGGRGGGGSGLSNSARGMDEEMEMDADGELDLDLIADPEDLPLMGGAEPTEKDETPYCFCQRVSFGEVRYEMTGPIYLRGDLKADLDIPRR